MRLVGGVAFSALLLTGAQAADYLRGPIAEPAYQPVPKSEMMDWSGFYVGGTLGYGSGRADPTKGANQINGAVLPNLEITSQAADLIHFRTGTARGRAFSVFTGYNTQWDDAVVGLEAEYTRANIQTGNGDIPDIGRRFTGASTHLWDVDFTNGSSKTTLKDYGVIRGRVGVAYGNVMPFLTAGLALGNLKTTAGITGSAVEYELQPITDPVSGAIIGYNRIVHGSAANTYKRTTTSNFTWGYAFGAGVDIAFTNNIFARGQYEYVSLGGNNATHLGLHTMKAGLGTKF